MYVKFRLYMHSFLVVYVIFNNTCVQVELELINKIYNYLLNLIYGIDNEDLECDKNSQINIESSNSNNISNEEEDINSKEDNENINRKKKKLYGVSW